MVWESTLAVCLSGLVPINGHFVLNRSQVRVHVAQAPFRQLLPPLKYGESHLALRSEEHTSELQSHLNLVCRLLLEKITACWSVCYFVGVCQRVHMCWSVTCVV